MLLAGGRRAVLQPARAAAAAAQSMGAATASPAPEGVTSGPQLLRLLEDHRSFDATQLEPEALEVSGRRGVLCCPRHHRLTPHRSA